MDEQLITGRILQGIGGFYYVEAADGIYECRARGSLRRQRITPLAGDFARISIASDNTGTVQEILPRKNSLIRPPVANLDCLLLVVSTTDPEPSLSVLDRLIAVTEHKGIEPIPVFSKTDLKSPDGLETIYRHAGFTVFSVCAEQPDTVLALRDFLVGKCCAVAGNSGVGKSTLLNMLDASLLLEVGETSKKLGRGRHTTRSACLYPQKGGGYIADTPGFSSLDAQRLEHIDKDEIVDCFREFHSFLGGCQFTSCSHTGEKGCCICEAVEKGEIARSRFESYKALYLEAKEWKQWENK